MSDLKTMTKKYLTFLLLLFLLYNTSAQTQTFTFDYQIDMKERYIQIDTVKSINEEFIRCTWLNSKDRNYMATMRYYKDSTQNLLIIYDFKNNQLYHTFTHRRVPEIILEVRPMGTIYLNLAQIETPVYHYKNVGGKKKIDGYLCKRILDRNADSFSEVWFTRDIPDAPEHAFHAMYMFYKRLPQYNGVVVRYRHKYAGNYKESYLIATQKNNRKITIKDGILVEFEGDLKTIMEQKKYEDAEQR